MREEFSTAGGKPKKVSSQYYDEKDDTFSTEGYDYGQTKRKLKVGLEVEGLGGGWKVKVGNWTLSTTGTLAITGLGFKPSSLRIVASYIGWGGAVSDWVTDWTTSRSVNWFPNPSTPAVENTDNLVYVNWSSPWKTVANLVSFDSDWFTLNFTSIGPSISFFYEARN